MSTDLATAGSVSCHAPVLCAEVIETLRASNGGSFFDCTLGGGGHTRAILDAHPQNRVVAIDRDKRALQRAKDWSAPYGSRLTLHHSSFSGLADLPHDLKYSGVLADLGLSSDQLAEGRGFSFHDDVLPDMRMDESQGQSAADYLATVSEQDLLKVLREGGVAQDARRIATAIIQDRPFASARALAATIARVARRKEGGSHPATVAFQAIRMAVNQELSELQALFAAVPALVQPGARFAVITFHSLEDEKVMRTLRRWAQGEEFSASWAGRRPVEAAGRRGQLVTKKAITAGPVELKLNPRARSARLRVFEFLEQ